MSNAPLRIFIGTDKRQHVAYTVLAHSIRKHATKPVAITGLNIDTLPVKRMGLTEFTYTRYLVPWLCDYQGMALFLDADMVLEEDVYELFRLCEGVDADVIVCQDAPRFEWPSMMMFKNERCQVLTPGYIGSGKPNVMTEWTDSIGGVSCEWNYCVGYQHADVKPKLIHYTAGIPVWLQTRECAFSEIWWDYARECMSTVSYEELMRGSVHHEKVVNGEINIGAIAA